MFIIVGLGNPGEKFNGTPHNAGFEALDFFATKNEFPKFEFSKKYNALIAEKDDVILVKPQTFMNESGLTVKKITTHHPLQTNNLIVVHDEIDLPLGNLKISKDSSAGGHKGVSSIIMHIGTQDFIRCKIGVCPTSGKPAGIETFVIKKFTQEEQQLLTPVISKTADALDVLINEGIQKAMNEFNR